MDRNGWKMKEHVLTKKWMTDNFVRKFNEKPWYNSLLKKSARNKWMAVPAGAIRQQANSSQGKHKLTESESRSSGKKQKKLSLLSFLMMQHLLFECVKETSLHVFLHL